MCVMGRDDNGTQWTDIRVYKKLSKFELISSWATTLVYFLISYGHLSVNTSIHYPHFNYEKTIINITIENKAMIPKFSNQLIK